MNKLRQAASIAVILCIVLAVWSVAATLHQRPARRSGAWLVAGELVERPADPAGPRRRWRWPPGTGCSAIRSPALGA